MTRVYVISCFRCGELLLAKADQRTRTCLRCGSRVEVERARKIAAGENAFEASAILRRLKNEAAEKRNRPRL